MNQFIKFAIFALAFGSAVMAFRMQALNKFYNKRNFDVTFQCGKGDIDPFSTIQFYGNGELLFDSTKRDVYPFLKNRKSFETVQFNNHPNTNGWKNVHCSINGTLSENNMTIPFIDGPRIRHPKQIHLRQNFTLACMGRIAPNQRKVIQFTFNSQPIATITNRRLRVHRSPHLRVFKGPNAPNSIVVQQLHASPKGVYSCAYKFNIPGNPLKIVRSNKFVTRTMPIVHHQISSPIASTTADIE